LGTVISILLLLGIVSPGLAQIQASQAKTRIVKQIEAARGVQIYADNSQGSPLFIQEASVKEISGDDFRVLVGEAPRHFKQSTYPEVVLLNSSAGTIRSFAIVVQSAADKPRSGYVLLKKNLSIPPNSTFKVTSNMWPKAERVSRQEGTRFVSGMRQPGLDSSKSWILGSASELRVTVGLVEFEDGTRWMISPNSNWDEEFLSAERPDRNPM
jgi:hypothetical protein